VVIQNVKESFFFSDLYSIFMVVNFYSFSEVSTLDMVQWQHLVQKKRTFSGVFEHFVFFRWPVINYYFFLSLINLTKFWWRA